MEMGIEGAKTRISENGHCREVWPLLTKMQLVLTGTERSCPCQPKEA